MRRRRGVIGAAWCAVLGGCGVLAGCASPPVGFDSPDPAGRLEAIFRADRTKDRSAIPSLIRQLESDDPLVRMAASGALESITGQTLGYFHGDPAWKRRQAVDRWVQWQQSQPPTDKQSPRVSVGQASFSSGDPASFSR